MCVSLSFSPSRRSTPGRKRLATRTLSLTSDSSDSEVEFNHLCGTSTKGKGRRSLEKRKGKRKKEEIQHEGRCPAAGGIRDEREGKGKGKDKGKRLVKKSSQPRRQEFDPPQDDEFDKVGSKKVSPEERPSRLNVNGLSPSLRLLRSVS